ncbi:MAG: nucleotidyltransferase domain-containing protein, partial [Elusimicrobia bacterium]|nr:nucleotidyltransferase domain-containing protein [Elusimicrobiota bacterium]
AGRESSPAPALAPAGDSSPHAAPSIFFDPGPRTASWPDRVRDRARYTKLLSRSFWWYMWTHVVDMWPSYQARWRKAAAEGPVSVSRPRDFFSAMRVTGMSGRFYVLGGSALEDDLVIAEFRKSFARWFDGPGVGAPQREAIERFMARAKTFNAEKRAHTNMYKNIRDPLIRASTMRPDQLTGYFDGLLPTEKEEATREFQNSGRMEKVRAAFLKVLRETLDEENPNDPHRVRAAIVLGSFASGSAGPNSDFDVEALVDGASNKSLPAFMKRLTARWDAAGWHKTHPVTVHDNASWPSWGLVNIVQTRHYLVVSPEPALVARLSRQAFESPATTLERGYTARGRVNRAVQRGIVTAATYAADLRAALGLGASSAH